MARPRSDNPKDHQLLIRVTASELRLLEAASALHRCTVNAYVRSLLEQNLAAIEADPLILQQLRLFQEIDARQRGRVVAMRRKLSPEDDRRH